MKPSVRAARRHRSLLLLVLAGLPLAIANCVDDETTTPRGFDLPETGTLDATVPRTDASDVTGTTDASTTEDATLVDATSSDDATAEASDDASDAPDAADADDASDAADADDGDAADAADADDASDADDAGDASDAADADDGDAPTSLPDGGVTSIDPVKDNDGTIVQVAQGPVGPPAIIGCADGQREGLVDHLASPRMAGCLGEWNGALDLRATATGTPCGDDITEADGGTLYCGAPADLCAAGWHLCGASGSVPEIAALGPTECENAGGARYVTAISHCQTQSGCEYDAGGTYSCFPTGWCSEPVCCGQRCLSFGVCPSGVWTGATHIPVGTDQGCGHITARRAGGVLCCKD